MRIIAHLDLDAFFASVEERERPYLAGAPIAVGTDPAGGSGRGVVSTSNYAARAYGIHSAIPIRRAWELSKQAQKEGKPAVVFITPHFRRYEDSSRRVMTIVANHLEGTQKTLFERTPPALEQVSVDECYFDLSSAGSFEKARTIASYIKKEIRRKEKLTASIGIGPNKLIAKIASDFEKPDGLTMIVPEQVNDFLEPLAVRRIPGIGPKAEGKLKRLGVHTVGQARRLFGTPPHQSALPDWCGGKWGSELFLKFRGEDDSPVVVDAPPAKSIGEQETLPEDSLNMKVLLPYLEREVKSVVGRMRKEGFKSFRTMALTVRFADFETVSRSRTVREPVAGAESLRRHITQMFFPFLDRRENPRHKKIRLLGVRVEKLS